MAKARSRTAARKVKDRWKAKAWYDIQAPPSFDNVTVADTLADSPDNLINRVTAVPLQDLTNDFRKSHIKLFFKIHKVEETTAHTQFAGHTLTSDYLRRMIRRRRSKIDGVYDVDTRDGATIRVKPFATTDKRIQNSQRKVVREAMKKTITDQAKSNTLAEFVKNILDGKTGSDIYKNCKKLYPVKRVEIHKTEVISQPSIMITEKKPAKKEEIEEPVEPEKVEKKTTKKKEKTEEFKEPETKEEKPEEPKEEVKEEKKEKPKAKKTTKKKPAKKAKKTEPKKTVKKPAAKKKTTKKTPAKPPAKTTTKKKTAAKKTTKKEKK
jgi:small subunit ribosomal protein S3Ae